MAECLLDLPDGDLSKVEHAGCQHRVRAGGHRGGKVIEVAGAAGRDVEVSRSLSATPGGRDFPKVGGNYGNQNYTALGGIHHGNIRRVGGAWVNRIEGGLATGTNQSTAVAVAGVLYIESAPGNVFAVDGRTGVTKWVYRQTRGTLTRRGVAVGNGKVYTHGRGDWIIALDQETGAVVWEKQISEFGNMEKVAVTHHDGRLHVGTHDGNRGAAARLLLDVPG